MIIIDGNICFGCMEKKGASSICPRCGYDNAVPQLKGYISPGTLIGSRYTVGRLLHSNGEGATYIGSDRETTCKVYLREFMPPKLCKRVSNKPLISVKDADIAQYKTLMAGFTVLHQTLAPLHDTACLFRIIGIFAENNTTYAAYEYVEARTLIDYLRENSGELSWEEAAKIFPPLFTLLGIIHNKKIFHRGISPQTIMVTSKGELKIEGFSISEARTSGTALDPEFFEGYTAYEQYNPSEKQGAWTDVYAISSVLYKVLTGTMPTDSRSRFERDDLPSPADINPAIPANVSNTIMKGLKVSPSDRIQSINELVTKLFDTPDTRSATRKTAVIDRVSDVKTAAYKPYNSNEVAPAKPKPAPERPVAPIETPPHNPPVSGLDRVKIPVIIGVLLLAILIVISVIVKMVLFPNAPQTTTTTPVTTTDQIITQETTSETMATTTLLTLEMKFDLVGRTIENARIQPWINKLEIVEEYEYQDEIDAETKLPKYPKGTVFEQSIKVGDMYTIGQEIVLKISKGTSVVAVPPITNTPILYVDYLRQLIALGITESMVNPIYELDNNYNPEEVIRTDKGLFNFKEYEQNGLKLEVYIARNYEYSPSTNTRPPLTSPITSPTTVATEPPDENPTE